jgi:hypothetical protein
MDRAAFLLLFSGLGLGWQPMPDGSNRYEYIVQVDPELLGTLAEGQSIPIVGEVPEHIQPVARVRVVVGSGEVPRLQLVTLMKPVDGTAPAVADATSNAATTPNSSIKLTQFYGTNAPQPSGAAEWNAAGNRYGTPAATAPPITPTTAPAANSFATSPPAASNEAYTWNSGEATTAAASGPLAQVGDGLQSATQPIRDGLSQVDESVRSAFGKVNDGAKQLFDELGRPIRGQAPAAAAGEWNAPPATTASTPGGAASPGGTAWNQADAVAAAAGAQSAPRYGSQPAAIPPWPGAPSATGAPSGQVAGSAVPNGTAPAETEWNVTPDTAGAPPATNDPWERANPRFRTGAAAATPGQTVGTPASPPAAGTDSPTWNSDGPQLPPTSGDLAGSAGAPWNPGAGAVAPPLGIPALPAIGKSMLDLPASRPLDGVDPAAPNSFGGLAASPPGTADVSRPASTTRILDATASGLGTRPAAAQTKPPTQEPASAPPAAVRDNTVAVLAAWVLLTGSIAGNLYLFWSYLDVRQKYRALVRKTARAVGSRFSAA